MIKQNSQGCKLLESRKVFEAKDGKTAFLELYQDIVRTPSGNNITYTKYHSSDVVIVVPFVNHSKLVMIRQYRYPLDKIMLEFPAGHVENGEEPLAAAKRELAEETGYRAKKIEYIYRYHPSVSKTKQLVYVFRACGLVDQGKTRYDSGEQIHVEIIATKQLRRFIAEGKVKNAGTLISYLLCCTSVRTK